MNCPQIHSTSYGTCRKQQKTDLNRSESTSIPVNPRTNRPVGYAFVDLATAAEATAAIEGLSGKEILSRKVSVQLARKPETSEAKEGAASGGEGASGNEGRKRTGGRGRGRGRARGRGGRVGRGRGVCFISPNDATIMNERANFLIRKAQEGHEIAEVTTPEQAPVVEATNDNEAAGAEGAKQQSKPRARPQKQRGPPEDGIASKTKVMVANLPYDLTEDKVRGFINRAFKFDVAYTDNLYSSRRSLLITSRSRPRLLCALSPVS